MHDPVGLDAAGRLPFVEHQRLLDPHLPLTIHDPRADRLVGAGGLPVAGSRRPVRPRPVRILTVPRAEKVPLFLPKHGLPCWRSQPNVNQARNRDDLFDQATKTDEQEVDKTLESYQEGPKDRTCKGLCL